MRVVLLHREGAVAVTCAGKNCTEILTILKKHDAVFHIKNFKPVFQDPTAADKSWRRVLLAPKITSASMEGLGDESAQKAVLDAVERCGGSIVQHTVTIGYDNMTVEAVLRRVLPAEIEVPSGFECIGHIAHVNLRDEQLPYKYLIGEVFLKKNPTLRTIVNKVCMHCVCARPTSYGFVLACCFCNACVKTGCIHVYSCGLARKSFG